MKFYSRLIRDVLPFPVSSIVTGSMHEWVILIFSPRKNSLLRNKLSTAEQFPPFILTLVIVILSVSTRQLIHVKPLYV